MSERPRQIELSEAGTARRGVMLDELLREVDRTRGVRRARRAVLSTGAAALVVVMVIGALWPRTARLPMQRLPSNVSAYAHVEVVSTKPDALAGKVVVSGENKRHTEVVESRPISALASVEVIDDRRLLDALAAAGRPTGLVTVGGVMRTTREVVDGQGGG